MCRLVSTSGITLKAALAQARQDQEFRTKFFIAPLALAAGPEAKRSQTAVGRRADLPARNETGANAGQSSQSAQKKGRNRGAGRGSRFDRAKRAGG
eukprot:1381970-Lingulodinium_polyedra.AAC.1